MLAVRKGNRAPTSQHRAEWLLRPSYSTALMNEREILLRTVTVHSAAHLAARRGLLRATICQIHKQIGVCGRPRRELSYIPNLMTVRKAHGFPSESSSTVNWRCSRSNLYLYRSL